MSDPKTIEDMSLEELRVLQSTGLRRLEVLEMCNLTDLRVSAHYEPYTPDSDFVLDRNLAQITKLKAALRRVSEAIARKASVYAA